MTPEIWTQLIDAGTTLVLALLVPLLGAGINVLLKKAKLDNNAAVTVAVKSGIAYAEELAASQLKSAGIKIDPSVKLETAVTRILEKIPGITSDEAVKLVKEELPKVGLGAAGFLSGIRDSIKN